MSSPSVPDLAAAVDAALPGELYEPDSLLPGPSAVVDRLTAHLADPGARPATLAVIGLLRRDDGWPTSPAVIATVTALLAGGLRADDWLAREGAAEFAVLVGGDPDPAEIAVRRLVGAVGGVISGIEACAGLAGVERGIDEAEIRRRAHLCLAAARANGTGTLVRYRGNR
jgi:GGDEF domain-containing protein